jgi:clan AA aspartic protease
MLFKGSIRNQEPVVTAKIDENGELNFASQGNHSFVVDTGFTGDIAVPHALLPKLNLEFSGYTEFVLATYQRVELPVYRGWVKIKHKRMKVDVVAGDELLGMGLLERIGSQLIVDFTKAEVKLLG